MAIDYGNEIRREWFERVFWSEHDRNHSAFQAFVSCATAGIDDALARRDWHAFQAGWNARELAKR